MSFPISNRVNILVIDQATPQFPTQERCLLGDLDVPLSQKGQEEANTLRRLMENCGIVFHRILCSDLKRATQTAEILAAGSNISIERLPELRETNKGDLQGLTREEYRKQQSYKIYKALPLAKERFFAPMGSGERVETKADLALRLIPLINALRNDKSLIGKTVLIVTHGNPIKVIDTLSKNPNSLNSPKDLKNQLQIIPDYADPKYCNIFLYTADPNSFESIGKLQLSEEGSVKILPSLELKSN